MNAEAERNRPRILVTGGTGFIGRAVCARLAAAGFAVTAAVRSPLPDLPPGIAAVWVGDVDEDTDWGVAVAGMEAVVHLAAPAHLLGPPDARILAAFRRINVDGTRHLAEAAAAAGVRRFLFVSTVKVNGEQTFDRPFTEDDPPRPLDAYGQTKLEAEMALRALEAATGMAVTILRPPLVHGPGVKGNLRGLLRACALGLPMPFSAVRNRRSFIHVDNLAHAIETCLARPAAAGRTYLVRDGRDLSTADLVRLIGEGMGRWVWSPAVAPELIAGIGRLLGVEAQTRRLLGSLAVDDRRIRTELDWQPPQEAEAGIRAMARAYRDERRAGRRPAVPVFPQRPDRPGVAVVIVSYNNADLVAVLEAAQRDPAVTEIIVVDNGNPPETRTAIKAFARAEPRCRVVAGHGNVGFAAGCNLGAALAEAEFLLLLNPDCFLGADTVTRLLEQIRPVNGDWVAGVRLLNDDGSEQKGARRNLGTPFQWLVEAFRIDKLPFAQVMPPRVNLNEQPLPHGVTAVPAISGAFMFMRRRFYAALSGMDQRYFLHFEDLDFCMKVNDRGGNIYFCPDITVMHKKSQSRASPLFVEKHKCRSMWIYFMKHFSTTTPKIVLATVWLLLSGGLIIRGIFRNLIKAGP